MGTTSSLRGFRSGRRRRVAVALGLCALTLGLLTLIAAPGGAGEAADRIVVRYGEENCSIRADQFQATIPQETIETFDGKRNSEVTVVNGATLEELLQQAEALCEGFDADAVKGIGLTRTNGSPYFVEPDADIVFWFQDGSPNWQRRPDPDVEDDENADDTGSLAERAGGKLNVVTTENELPTVTLSSSPKDVGVDDTVTFKVSVKNVPDELRDELEYTWTFGDNSDAETTSETSRTHVYKKKGTYTASVTVEADEVGGADQLELSIEAESQQQDESSGGGGSGGGPGSGGSGSGPGGGSTAPGSGGGFPPSPGPSFPSPTPPSTDPALPPPDTPPPSDSTPTNPDDFGTPSTTEPGEEVTGVVISTVAAPDPAGGGGKPNAAAEQDKPREEEAGVDWKVSTGAILAGLLLILGGLREHMPTRQLLPKAS